MLERDENQKMSREEAGSKGGEQTAKTHGREFYEETGREGGQKVSEDREQMSKIGQEGGEARGRERQEE